MALARQHKRDQDLVEGVDLSEIDIAVANAQKVSDTSGDGSKGKNEEPEQEPEGPNKFRRTAVVIAVVLASLIMALSILLPSLSAVIEGLTSASEAATTEAATEESSDAETEDAESEEDETANQMQEYIDTVDERYSSTADSLQAKVDADSTDMASLINLANTYYTWGTSISYYVTSDAQKEHQTELLQKALNLYDQYLASNSSNAAQVNKAMCQYYMGDTASAIAALEDFCSKNATYAPAWSDLGMMYNAQGDTEKALNAYNQVVAVDPDDKYGLKSSAESQITSLSASTEEAAEESAETTETTEAE